MKDKKKEPPESDGYHGLREAVFQSWKVLADDLSFLNVQQEAFFGTPEFPTRQTRLS
jgi:hypothetical protein